MAEFSLTEDNIHIAYRIYGPCRSQSTEAGAAGHVPVMLLHGFASDGMQNWHSTGWVRTLTEAGRKVIVPDFRGHGESDKPHDPALYGAALLHDVEAVLERENIPLVDLMGYSMGGSVSLLMLKRHPEMVRRAILAGVGSFYLSRPLPMDSIARALERDEDDGPLATQFRLFASQEGKDKKALAACVRALPPRFTKEMLAEISHPLMVVCGTRDGIAGEAPPLAACFPNAKALVLEDKDHMSAVGDLSFKREGLTFLT